jgi:hypothetical protein
MVLVLDAAGVNNLVVPVTSAITEIEISGGLPGQFLTLLFLQDGVGHAVNAGGGNIQGLPTIADEEFDVTACSLTFNSQANTWVCTSGAGGVSIEINGTPASSQAVLNLTAGAGITITDEGSGEIAIAASGGIGMQVATVTLTSPQILALKETPVQLAASPGAGFAILPVVFFLRYNFVTTPYGVTSTTGAIGTAGMLGNDNPWVAFGGTGVMDQTASTFFAVPGESEAGPLSTVGGAMLIGNIGADDFITGDGTLTVTMYYVVVPT